MELRLIRRFNKDTMDTTKRLSQRIIIIIISISCGGAEGKYRTGEKWSPVRVLASKRGYDSVRSSPQYEVPPKNRSAAFLPRQESRKLHA